MSKLAHSNTETMEQIELRRMDREANTFAMELLMPAHLLKAEIKNLGGIDIEDDRKLAKLARKFKVSLQVMAVRIGQLYDRKGRVDSW